MLKIITFSSFEFSSAFTQFFSIFRHVIVSCQDEEKLKSKFALSKVLRSLQVQTESFLVLLLQIHILSHTFQLVSSAINVIRLQTER